MSESLHALVCWHHGFEPNTIEEHQKVIDTTGHVWWGKFKEVRYHTGVQHLDPVGEGPLDPEHFYQTICQQIERSIETRLYVCNPDPAFFSLHVGLIEALIKSDSGDHPFGVQAYSNIPTYYFDTPARDRLNFGCTYWFKLVDRMYPLHAGHLQQLTDCSESDKPHPLTFSIPCFYPLPIVDASHTQLFQHSSDIDISETIIPRKPMSRDASINLTNLHKFASGSEHHRPKGAPKFLDRLVEFEYLVAFRFLAEYSATVGGAWIKEVNEEGDLVCVYSSDRTLKFLIKTSARGYAEGQWIAREMIGRGLFDWDESYS